MPLRARNLTVAALCVTAAVTSARNALALNPPSFALEWGSVGSNPGEFLHPEGVAVGTNGAIYVSDGSDRVQKFDRFGNFILQWGAEGTADGQFKDPQAIAVTGSGGEDTLYVADMVNNRIQKFAGDGTFILKWGSFGDVGPGEFDWPRGVTVDDSGRVYVVDWYGSRIQRFMGDGTYIDEGGGYGTGVGQLDRPGHIALDSNGNVYVVEWGNERVQKFTSNGTYLAMWGSAGTGDGEFMRPFGIAIGPGNILYVGERNGDRVQAFTSGGTFLCKWGSTGTGEGEFETPTGITITDEGTEIFVAGGQNHRVQKFTYNPTGIGEPVRPPRLVLQSRPNPFTEQTTIRYSLPQAGPFQLAVYDVRGRLVRLLATGDNTTGDRVAQWRGFDQAGERVSSGVYFVRLTTEGQSTVTKLHLIR